MFLYVSICFYRRFDQRQSEREIQEVKRDILGTLQTLQQNLRMAKILGSVDADAWQMSDTGVP